MHPGMTDTTPHESLPLPVGTRRQYFRLVTNHVSVWYADHSDANPLGVVPDPKITTIVWGNKFTTDGGGGGSGSSGGGGAGGAEKT